MADDLFAVTDKPVSIGEITQKVIRPECGAVTTFTGTVRELTNGKRTLSLEYHAYKSMAVKMLEQIGQEIQEKWPDTLAAITHRTGHLQISDIAVVIAVSSPHRKAAYEANQYAIERIKEIVPIWKKEHWADGTKWVGDQLETTAYPQGKPPKGDAL
ncbi:molybdopterin synthase catalytic subunit [Alteribacillus persepolensis]|uniref:Molybdopterin synthase catalytic subunit n=1 Tax=Alteribacillus persepolensis TaxID=568899 RepID=A0A1G8FXY5_9BACI|nr:molybdenum cofactor biosynthesis protein MoaE [Alteribacillus persepolensis]SDH86983.1 molybdopterin synthase catalytic subunit [Alteribacillus persepolensis]